MIFADVSPTDASVAKTVSVWLNGRLYGYVVPACLDPAVGDTVIVPAKHHSGCSDPYGPDHQNLYLVRVAKLRIDGYDGPLKTVQCGHGPDCPHDTGLLSANGAIKDMSGIDKFGIRVIKSA